MGRHVWFRTPTKHDRLDILDLYIGKVSHDADLDRPARRDEIARITNGYSPAMIEQVTSMALTIAHHSGRDRFQWEDLVESITTIETGTAVGIEYVPQESRATAIHEAGHAVAGHAYMTDTESTRLSIRMRGGSLGHHQAREKEERFSRFQSELFARLVWGLGAMAAERVFYAENSSGVGGDVQSVTSQAAWMVGSAAMGPIPFRVEPLGDETEEQARGRVLERFERIGLQIMSRTGNGGPMAPDPIASVLGDPAKRAYGVADARPGLRRGTPPRRSQPRGGREGRGRRARAEGAVRRRAARAARSAAHRGSPGRPERRGLLASPVLRRRAAPAAGVAPRWRRSRVSEDPARSTVVEAEPAQRVGSVEPVSRSDRARRSAYRSRFAGVYIVLAAVVGVAVGSFIVIAGTEPPQEAAAWSDWQPSGSSSARLNQIAVPRLARVQEHERRQTRKRARQPAAGHVAGRVGEPAPDVPGQRDRGGAGHVDRPGGRRHRLRPRG